VNEGYFKPETMLKALAAVIAASIIGLVLILF